MDGQKGGTGHSPADSQASAALYEVRDENGKSLTLPADALEPCKIDRDEGDGAFGRYLTVNDLMYCPEHELEVCGSCGVDHRATNFLHECTWDNAVTLSKSG